MLRTVKRVKRTVRHAIRKIGCDHPLTLTTRKEENDPEMLAERRQEFAWRDQKFAGVASRHVAMPFHPCPRRKYWNSLADTRPELRYFQD